MAKREQQPSAMPGADAESRAHAGTLAEAVLALQRSEAELVADWQAAAVNLQLEAQATCERVRERRRA